MDSRNIKSLDKLIQTFSYAYGIEDYWAVRRYIIQCKEGRADINIVSSKGKTPLINVIQRGATRYAADIISLPELNPNLADSDGNTPLMVAVMKQDNNSVSLLLQRKDIDINARNKNGDTALLLSAKEDNLEITKLLVDYPKINLNIANNQGITPLIAAAMEKRKGFQCYHTALFLLTCDAIDVNAIDNNGNSALHHSAHDFWGQVLGELVRHKDIKINCVNQKGQTPLILAIKAKSNRNIKALISQPEIDFSVIDKEGRSAVMWQAVMWTDYNRDNQLEEQLLSLSEDQVNINSLDENGYTALMWAIKERSSHYQIATYLAAPDLDINRVDFHGNTALNLAAQLNKHDMVEKILRNPHVDVNLANKKNETPILWSVRNNNFALFNLLKTRKDIDINKAMLDGEMLSCAVKQGSSTIIAELLKLSQSEVNILNNVGDTSLIHAIKNNYKDIAINLLACVNTQINSKDSNGNTALMNAVEKNYVDLAIRLLVKDGIELNAINNNGDTALMIAASLGYFEITFVLLNKLTLAEINTKNKSLHTAAQVASQNLHADVAELINKKVSQLSTLGLKSEIVSSSGFNGLLNLGFYKAKPQQDSIDSKSEPHSPYVMI